MLWRQLAVPGQKFPQDRPGCWAPTAQQSQVRAEAVLTQALAPILAALANTRPVLHRVEPVVLRPLLFLPFGPSLPLSGGVRSLAAQKMLSTLMAMLTWPPCVDSTSTTMRSARTRAPCLSTSCTSTG